MAPGAPVVSGQASVIVQAPPDTTCEPIPVKPAPAVATLTFAALLVKGGGAVVPDIFQVAKVEGVGQVSGGGGGGGVLLTVNVSVA